MQPHRSLQQLPSIEAAMAMEEQMFARVVAGEVESEIAIWSAPQSLVAPFAFARREAFAEAAQASGDAGWPVAVRRTGGGITPQGPGIINVSVAFANHSGSDLSIEDGYTLLCRPIAEELARLGIAADCAAVPEAFCDGKYNLAVDGRKLAGTAQRRSWVMGEPRRQAILVHALIMVDCDAAELNSAVNALSEALGENGQFQAKALCCVARPQPDQALAVEPEAFASSLALRFDEVIACITSAAAPASPTPQSTMHDWDIQTGRERRIGMSNLEHIGSFPTASRRGVLQGMAGAATAGALAAGATSAAAKEKGDHKPYGPQPDHKFRMLASSLIHNGRHEAFYGRATALFPFEYRMAQVAKAGFTGVGLLHWDLDHTFRYEAKGDTMDEKIRWMDGVLKKNGLVDVEIEFLTGWMWPKDDPRRQAEQPVRDMLLQMAKIMRPHHMKVGNFFTPNPLGQIRDNFRELCDEFGDYTEIAYEILTNDPNGGDIGKMISIVEGSHNGGLFLDTWHTNNIPDLSYADIATIPAGLLKGVELDDGWLVEDVYKPHFAHISSVQFIEMTIHCRACLGEGNFDVVGFINACRANGFDGPWGNEILSENVARYPLEMMLPHIYKTSLAHMRNAYFGTPIPPLIRADYT